MAEHSASVTVNAPIQQVYELFTHFNDFPKFMSFVKEVTYYDDQRSHWVVQVGRQYEWDAINENWIVGRQIGWRSTSGLRNSGRVKFRALGPERTGVDVYVMYSPPSGALGQVGETLGVGAYFSSVLQKDLNHFARMVEQAPPGALDPMSSHYLFHNDSALVKGQITARQKQAMASDPMMSDEALAQRQRRIAREAEERQKREQEVQVERQRRLEIEQRLQREQQETLERELVKRRQEQLAREEAQRRAAAIPLDPRHSYAAWARGLGDKDGLRVRDPNAKPFPMTSRRLSRPSISAPPASNE